MVLMIWKPNGFARLHLTVMPTWRRNVCTRMALALYDLWAKAKCCTELWLRAMTGDGMSMPANGNGGLITSDKVLIEQ